MTSRGCPTQTNALDGPTVPDSRTHRGPHPEDRCLFAADVLPRLRTAVDDYCWLLDRGYATYSSLKLVGDHYGLTARQRVAVARSSCTQADSQARHHRMVDPVALHGQAIALDGYNVLTTVEAALGGGVALVGRDGCLRDMASMHGSYRKVAETRPALEHIGVVLDQFGPSECVWYLDRPVSNSGRLRTILLEVAAAAGRPWRVELAPDPDPILAQSDGVVATADSAILDSCVRWVNLARIIVETRVPQAWVVQL
jgi:hypothetical protein